MSSITASLAVAVSARSDGAPSSRKALPISRKAGRKSWPHCEMQCASSITSIDGGRSANRAVKSRSVSRSGVVKTIFASPLRIAASAAAISSAATALFNCTAARPRPRSLSHWSFISAISGDTTRVAPGSSTAGSW